MSIKKRMPISMDSGRTQIIPHNIHVSKRLQLLLKKEIEIRYTFDDLKLLYNMLKDVSKYDYIRDELCINFCLNEYLNYHSISLDENVEDSYPLTMWEYYSISKEISLSHYLLLFYRKVFMFMTCVPLTSVPKYIGTEMGIYAEWRLQIHK